MLLFHRHPQGAQQTHRECPPHSEAMPPTCPPSGPTGERTTRSPERSQKCARHPSAAHTTAPLGQKASPGPLQFVLCRLASSSGLSRKFPLVTRRVGGDRNPKAGQTGTEKKAHAPTQDHPLC